MVVLVVEVQCAGLVGQLPAWKTMTSQSSGRGAEGRCQQSPGAT